MVRKIIYLDILVKILCLSYENFPNILNEISLALLIFVGRVFRSPWVRFYLASATAFH